MYHEPLRILAVNPGGRYLGIAAFRGPELLDWGVKSVSGDTLRQRLAAASDILLDLTNQYKPDALAIKALHDNRSSPRLDRLIEQIEELARRKKIKLRRYSIQALKDLLCPGAKINKRKLAEHLVAMYPALAYDLEREKEHKNPYRVRMFEAVALGTVCYQHLEDKQQKAKT